MKRRLLVFASVLLAALLLVSCGKAYKVNFDLDGGQLEGIAETVEVKKGAKVEHPGDPTKDGHEFEGWFLDDAEYDFDAKVEADLDLKAQWKKVDGEEPEPGEYKVVFDVNHPDGPHVKAQIVTEGQKAVEPAAPVIPYHKFLGWYLGNAKFNFNRAIQQDFILEARWEALTVHEIVYEGVEDTDFGYADKEDMIDAFFKDFYAYMTPENVTYEQFVHAVPGDFNGFWKNYANDKKLYSGAIANLNKLDGSTFATHEVYGPKWFSFFDFLNDWVNGVNTAQFFWTAGGSAVSTGVTRLQQYAVGTLPSGWPAHVYNEYMIQMPEELVKFKPVKLYVEGEGTELPVPTKYPFAFEGWYDNSDFAGDRIESLDADAKGAKTLYAKWRELEEFTVTVTLNYDGAKAIDPEVVNETDLAARPATPARDNHIFDGWTSDAKGEVPYNFSAPVMGNTVIYAKWLEAVFVTYDYDTEDVEDVEVKMVKDTKPAQPANPTKPGFKFEGWFDGEEEFDFGEKLDKDVTLVAKWEELEEYTIEYVFNDGEMMTAFADRDEMVVAFLTDYYNFISGYPDVYDTSKNTLEEFIGDTGKPNDISVPTAPKYKYDGNFNTAMALLTQQDMSVDLESRYFVAQLEYNKWRPLIEAMETFTHVGNPDQHIWGVAEFRVKPFIGMLDLWRYHDAPTTKIIKDAMELIPQQYLEPITKYDEQSEFPLPFPVMDSAEFLGWYDNEDFTGEPIFAIEPGTEGNLKLYAKWNKLDVVKATYHYDEGQFETVIILKNNLLDEPADPVKNLHQFKGWYLNAEFTGDLFDFDTELTKNIDLYAKWEKQPTVFVEFDPNNDDEKVEVEILKDSLASMPETPIKDGFEFMGWYDGETKFDFEEEVTKDVELVAKWQEILSVVHHYDGGAFGAENMINLLESVHVVAPRYAAGADPTGKSYSISTTKSVWWYALAFKETGVPMVYELMGKQGANKDPEGFDPKDKDIAFYVQYHDGLKGNFVSQIKQIYTDIKVGDLLVIPNLPAEMESANDKSINLHYFYEFKLDDQYPVRFDYFEDLITPFKEGFLFDGWYSDEAKTEKVEELPESISKNLDLYAKWIEIPAYAITLDQNYNAPVAAKAELTEDKKIDANKDYYTRVASEAGIGKLNDGTYVYTKVAEPVEVDLNKYYELINLGSDSEPVIDIVNQYQDLALEMPKTPLRKGYLFTHWLLDGELYDFNTPITKDIKLVAGWYKLLTFDVTFMVDGEEYEVVPTEEYAAVVLPASPTKAGNIFEGWLLDGELYDAKAPVEGDLELVASWLGSVKVTYKLYDGMIIVIEIVSGEKLAKPASPTRNEFIFQKWVVDGKEFDFDTLITKDTVLEAEWIPAPYYDIVYHLGEGEFVGDFTDREEMIEAFLSDFYDHLTAIGKLNTTLHPTFAEFKDWYYKNESDETYINYLVVADTDFVVNPASEIFISQPQYNKWVPLLELMNEYVVTVNANQTFYKVGSGSAGVGYARVKRFMIKHAYNAAAAVVAGKIPAEYVQLKKYSIQSPAYTFSEPIHARRKFLGWYDNAGFTGNPVVSLNVNLEKELNLYAKWSEPYYSLDLEANGGTFFPVFDTKEEMVEAFLLDWYDHLVAIDVLNKVKGREGEDETDLNSFEEFRDWYLNVQANDVYYTNYLVTDTTDFVVDENSDVFISQEKYNFWIPLLKVINEYANTGNPAQVIYKDNGVGGNVAWARLKPYIQNRNLWSWEPRIPEIMARVPGEFKLLTEFTKDTVVGDLIIPNRDGYEFLGWYDNAEFTGDAIVKIDPTDEVDMVLYAKWNFVGLNYDFGTETRTGYAAGDLTWTNTDGTEVTASKDRVQINTSTFAPHNGDLFLVFSIKNTHDEAWIELDFTEYKEMKEISFEINVWNNTLLDTVKDTEEGKFILQVKVDGEWVDVKTKDNKDNLLPLLKVDEYVKVEFDVDGAGLYRIIYSGTSAATNNTTTAITVDNLLVE